jgi:hypothetical protein
MHRSVVVGGIQNALCWCLVGRPSVIAWRHFLALKFERLNLKSMTIACGSSSLFDLTCVTMGHLHLPPARKVYLSTFRDKILPEHPTSSYTIKALSLYRSSAAGAKDDSSCFHSLLLPPPLHRFKKK